MSSGVDLLSLAREHVVAVPVAVIREAEAAVRRLVLAEDAAAVLAGDEETDWTPDRVAALAEAWRFLSAAVTAHDDADTSDVSRERRATNVVSSSSANRALITFKAAADRLQLSKRQIERMAKQGNFGRTERIKKLGEPLRTYVDAHVVERIRDEWVKAGRITI